MARPTAPTYVPDGLTLVKLPYDSWAVLRSRISRKAANYVREAFWGPRGFVRIEPGTLLDQMPIDTRRMYEEWVVRRVETYVKDWNCTAFCDPGDDREEMPVLPIAHDSVELVDDEVFVELAGAVTEVLVGATEDAKSEDGAGAAALRLGAGAADAPAEPAEGRPAGHEVPALAR